MAEFWTGDDISKEYAVGVERLLAFAVRGNLPMRVEDGERLYDVQVVERLFRRRDAAETQGFTLGSFKLGEALDQRATPRASSERLRHSVRAPRMRTYEQDENEQHAPQHKANVA